ncbi:MAG: tripartite tricarboxylate transporter substrate binding protein [Betaproteobacteria bacterium]|nr:tripartite tricarboxylate transporter substrate binding protein [Betaproteobacteria bacterium]
MSSATCVVAGLALCCFAALASAQGTYPNKTIRMIVPFPAGGPTDIVARTVAQKMTDSMGQPVVIDNRGGSGGNIGTEIVARATPDGYTLLMAIVGHVINPYLYSRVPYDPVKDFVPITKTAAATIMLSAHPSLQVKSLKELITAAKARPRQITIGSPGSGTPHHLAAELFKNMAGIDLIHVPYKGAAPAIADLLGGQVNLAIVSLPAAYPHAKAGKIVALGVTSPTRSAVAPEVPTFAEAGLGGYDLENWYGLLAPAGTPRAVIDKLNRETVRSLQLADVKERLNGQGFEIRTSTPEEFAAYIKTELVKWSKIVKASGAKVD